MIKQEHIAQFEHLKRNTTIRIPEDARTICNLYATYISNKSEICPTCTSALSRARKGLIAFFNKNRTTQKTPQEQVQEYADADAAITKEQIQAVHSGKVISFILKDDFVFINRRTRASFKLVDGKIEKL
jgi:hypothetical protein